MVTDRSNGGCQYGHRGGRQPHSVPAHMAGLQTASLDTTLSSGKSYVVFEVFVVRRILCCFRYWSVYKLFQTNRRGKTSFWEKTVMLQKVTFLECTLEPDVPLKSICGQGLCRETNCYKGKNSELQHTGYKKKLHQEKERILKKDILGVLHWQLWSQVTIQARKELDPAPTSSTDVLLDFDQTTQASLQHCLRIWGLCHTDGLLFSSLTVP